MLFSELIGINHSKLEELGVFDCFLDIDSEFSINIQRLKNTRIPEFVNSYNKINNYFDSLGEMLNKSENKRSRLYRGAIEYFNFSEISEIRLGYSKGSNGNGFGKKLREKTIEDAYEIIKAGCTKPELFELIGLFEPNIGADRISDMIGTIIKDDIQKYTLRVLKQLKIINRKSIRYDEGFIINPYTNKRIYLLPIEILHKLPIVKSWEDVVYAAKENEILRKQINRLIGNRWEKLKPDEKKKSIKDSIFLNSEIANDLIEDYKTASIKEIDPNKDFSYIKNIVKEKVNNECENYNFDSEIKDSLDMTLKSFSFLKFCVENRKLWYVIKDLPTKNKEKCIQIIFDCILCDKMFEKGYDSSRETDNGRGPLDFKISKCNDKTVCEIKLSSNPKCKQGYENQIREYAKAERTSKMVFIIIKVNDSKTVDEIIELNKIEKTEGITWPQLIVIDAREKESASNYKE